MDRVGVKIYIYGYEKCQDIVRQIDEKIADIVRLADELKSTTLEISAYERDAWDKGPSCDHNEGT